MTSPLYWLLIVIVTDPLSMVNPLTVVLELAGDPEPLVTEVAVKLRTLTNEVTMSSFSEISTRFFFKDGKDTTLLKKAL